MTDPTKIVDEILDNWCSEWRITHREEFREVLERALREYGEKERDGRILERSRALRAEWRVSGKEDFPFPNSGIKDYWAKEAWTREQWLRLAREEIEEEG